MLLFGCQLDLLWTAVGGAQGSSARPRDVGGILRRVLTLCAIATLPQPSARRERAPENRHDTTVAAGRYTPPDPRRSAYKDEQEIGNLRREVTIALEVSHPHLVRTLGTVLVDAGCGFSSPGLVMEIKRGGSLAELLHGPSSLPSDTHTAGTAGLADGATHSIDRLPQRDQPTLAHGRPVPSAELRQRLVHEVLSGLAYLHELSIMHRDIKTANVLLDGDLHAAVCDFSISTRFSMELTNSVGTLRYMAPEVCFGRYDAKADVFAYGMLLWETLHVEVPFSESHSMKAFFLSYSGKRPPIQLAPPLDRYVEFIQRCWHQSPEMRPSAATALALVEGLSVGATV